MTICRAIPFFAALFATFARNAAAETLTFSDVAGRTLTTAGRVSVIVVGPTNCVPFQVMVSRELAPFVAAHSNVFAAALFPCTIPSPGPLRAWQSTHAPAFAVAEVPITSPTLDRYFSMPDGVPLYAVFIYDSTGKCVYESGRFTFRDWLEPRLTMTRNGPHWNRTALPWELVEDTPAPSCTFYRVRLK